MNALPNAVTTSMGPSPLASPVASPATVTTSSGFSRSAKPATTIRMPISVSTKRPMSWPGSRSSDRLDRVLQPRQHAIDLLGRHCAHRQAIPSGVLLHTEGLEGHDGHACSSQQILTNVFVRFQQRAVRRVPASECEARTEIDRALGNEYLDRQSGVAHRGESIVQRVEPLA